MQQADKRLQQAAAALLSSHRDAPLLIALGAWREATVAARFEKAKERCMQQADKRLEQADQRLLQAL
eukprot:12250022-Heterocapsa_arctica.AAC.1